MLKYHAAYYDGENGWIAASVLDFPGALSQGKTLRSAQRMIRDALKTLAESYVDDGIPLPRPNPRAKDKKAMFAEELSLSIRVPLSGK